MKRTDKIAAALLVLGMMLAGCDNIPRESGSTKLTEGTESEAASSATEGTDKPKEPKESKEKETREMPEQNGDYNYAEALQKSLLFYELQRSGELGAGKRTNWRGNSGMDDGKDQGVDLTGGLYDAGDHVKFNLPMAYTATMLAWSVYEDKDVYEWTGELSNALGNIKWICDYLMKCHPEDEVFYYQVGDGGADHSWWGPCEVMNMQRPSFKVTKSDPGSAVCGEAAAALAAASVVFESEDEEYSKKCLEHAKSLFKFADETRSDAGYKAANGFYDSWSGFYDELALAGSWLYRATEDDQYLKKAEECFGKAGHDFDWALCWDDVHIGAALLLLEWTGEDKYKDEIEKHLDFWSGDEVDGKKITYTPKGLAWLDSWGSLRYASTSAFVAMVYARMDTGPQKDKYDKYVDFATKQAEYCLGSTGFSYQIGYGDEYPMHPHHRTSQGSYCDNMNEPSEARHELVGALVGGPDANDQYSDTVSDYNKNEVACDYNAGFTGLMAAMVGLYGGTPLTKVDAIEPVGKEYEAECGLNVEGEDFAEIKAVIKNETAWPARASKDLEFCYFVDLSEIVAGGGKPEDIKISTNYMKSGRVDGLKVYDKENNIWYLSVMFDDGTLAPGGQDRYKSEIQVRMTCIGIKWDNTNDPSFKNGAVLKENGQVVFGVLPDGTGSGITSDPKPTEAKETEAKETEAKETTAETSAAPTETSGYNMDPEVLEDAKDGDLSLKMTYNDDQNAITGTIDITNNTDLDLDLKNITICYYFTNDGGAALTFDCYHAAKMSSYGVYTAMTDIVTGEVRTAKGEDTDSVLEISVKDGYLTNHATFTVNFSLHRTDWQKMDGSNDWSHRDQQNIVVRRDREVILGKAPEA